MLSLKSNDGTMIAYDKIGSGPPVILINGALAHRGLNGEQQLAALLAKRFTVIFYDRRGRGESADTKPYSAANEIADVESLTDAAGGKVFLYGASSGAALALQAAAKLGHDRVRKLALYEPPYDAYLKDGKNNFAEIKRTIQELVGKGRAGDAIAFFFESIGTPQEMIEGIRQAPFWKDMEQVGPTLVYDFELLGDGLTPVSVAKKIAIPTLIMDGEQSYDFMRTTAATLAKTIPNAQHKTLSGQTHQVSPEALFPVLFDFFSQP